MKKHTTSTHEAKLKYLHVLEQNSMNISLTAKQLGIARTTLYNCKKKYWNEYLQSKQKTKDQIRELEVAKFEINRELERMSIRMSHTFEYALNRVDSILKDTEELKKLSNRDLIQLINVIAPYVAERKGVLTEESKDNQTQKKPTSIVQTIIEHMNMKVNDSNK